MESCLLTLAILGVFTSLLSSCWSYHDPKFQLALEMLQHDGITPEEIMVWWEKTKNARSQYSPRVFPICIAPSKLNYWPSNMINFGNHFDRLAKIKVYDPKIHSWESRQHKFVSELNFRAISLQPQQSSSDDDEAKDQIALRQWLTFTLTLVPGVKALYVQSIAGPLGIPAGEFSLDDLRCQDESKDDHYKYDVIPCSFTPRGSDLHPNALVMDNQWTGGSVNMSFRYRWSEAQCQETGYFQFIIIATIDYNNFETALSPIYRITDLQTGYALQTPYHPYYKNVLCTQFKTARMEEQVAIHIANDGTRIIPNVEYDDCVLNGVGRGETDLDKLTCPPGPFKCETIWETKDEWKMQMNNWWITFVETTRNVSDCCEIGPIQPIPTTATTRTTTTSSITTSTTFSAINTTKKPSSNVTKAPSLILLQKQSYYLKEKSRRTERKSQISHGDLCIFTWFVLVPIANHASRFLKDFPDFKSVGMGIWIILHVALHSLGMLLIWVSFGLIIGGGENKLGDVSGQHFLLGVICTIFQHLQFYTGLLRNQRNERASFIYVLTHSLSGYISHFFGYVAVFLSNARPERKWLSVGFFIIWLLGLVTSCVVEKKQDNILGVVFHRAQCPVLQRIMIDDGGRPPLMKVKIAILLFLCIGQGTLFVAILTKYSVGTVSL